MVLGKIIANLIPQGFGTDKNMACRAQTRIVIQHLQGQAQLIRLPIKFSQNI